MGYIKAQIQHARESRIGYHCTLVHDLTQDPELEKEWQEKVARKAAAIDSQYIVIGPQGAAMMVQDADQSSAIKDWFKETNKVAHITLLINKGFKAKDLGEIMFNEKQQTWEKNR